MSARNDLLRNLEANLHKVKPQAEEVKAVAWTLDDAVALIRVIEKQLAKVHAHVGITGGVLFRGKSAKDLDLIVYPHNASEPPKIDKIKDALAKCDIYPAEAEQTATSRPYSSSRQYRTGGSLWFSSGDNKFVSVYETMDGRRIDIMFLDFS